MNRRKFLKMLGIVPLAPLVIKGLNIPKVKNEYDEYHPYHYAKFSKRHLTHRYSEGKVEQYKPSNSDKDARLL